MQSPRPRTPGAIPLRRTAQRFVRCRRGIGLVELLVVMPMMAVVLLGIYGLYNVGAKGQIQNQRPRHTRSCASRTGWSA